MAIAKLTKSQLARVLENVEANVATMLKSEEEGAEGVPLNKANPGEETPAEETPSGSSTAPPEPEAEASASPAPGGEGPPPSAEGSAPGAEGSAGSAGPEGSGDPVADAAQGQMDPEAIKAELMQLPLEELKVIFMAAKAAVMEQMAGAGGGDPAAGAGGPPPGPEASASPAPGGPEASAGGPPPAFGKKEIKASGNGSGGKISAGSMKKNEDEIVVPADIMQRLLKAEAGLAQVEELKKALADKDKELEAVTGSIGKVADGFKALLTKQQGLRKSVAGISVQGKPDGGQAQTEGDVTVDVTKMSKSEVDAKLRALTEPGAKPLSPTDSKLIKGYYSNVVPLAKLGKLLSIS